MQVERTVVEPIADGAESGNTELALVDNAILSVL